MASIGGSGLDVQAIVDQLMKIERRPVRQIDSRIFTVEKKISALGKLQSGLSDLKELAARISAASKLGRFTAESSDDSIVSATVSTVEVEENHAIEVTRLAARHRIASTTVYQSPSDSVGAGDYTYSVGDKRFTVTLTEDAATLKDLSNAINRAADNPGVNAAIIHVDNGYRLVLSSRESGTANIIGAAGDWEEISTARDATIVVDGLTIHPTSNTVTDVIPGVTLTLKSEGVVSLTTRVDKEKMGETLDEFAKKYNAMIKTLHNFNQGDLKGEGLDYAIESRLRNIFFSSQSDANGAGKTAFAYGFTFDKEGVLSVDKTRLGESIDSDLNGLLDFFSGDNGFGATLTSALDEITRSNGLINSRKRVFNDAIDRLNTRSDQLESRMEKLRQRYLKTYSELDALMAQMDATSNRIGQSLGALVANGKP